MNALGGRGLSSNLHLAEAICERLQEVGIKAGDIVVWDHDSDELERAGFHLSMGGNGVQCFGTDRVDYEQELVTYGSVGSRLSRILTQRCNVLINVPVLKDHDGAGVTIALKNMYGVIHNPNKYHPNGCNPYIANLNMLPDIRGRMRLTICDATTAQYEGGPAYKPEYSWNYNALIVSQDPVALDYTGWQIIERKRAEKGLKTLEAEGRAPHYITTAADAGHRLGTNDPRRDHGRRDIGDLGLGAIWCMISMCGQPEPPLLPEVRHGVGSGTGCRRVFPVFVRARVADRRPEAGRFAVHGRGQVLPEARIRRSSASCVRANARWEIGSAATAGARKPRRHLLLAGALAGLRRACRSHRKEAVLPLSTGDDCLLTGHGRM